MDNFFTVFNNPDFSVCLAVFCDQSAGVLNVRGFPKRLEFKLSRLADLSRFCFGDSCLFDNVRVNEDAAFEPFFSALFILANFGQLVFKRLFIWRLAVFNLFDTAGNIVDQQRVEAHFSRFDYAVFIQDENGGNHIDFEFFRQIADIVANAIQGGVPLL